MTENSDLTLFYKIKERYNPAPGIAVFISATSENIDELIPQFFTQASYSEFQDEIRQHCRNSKPYFVVSRVTEGNHIMFYACKEFAREESLDTGKVTLFRLNPFRTKSIDINKVKEELKTLGEILRRNSKAS